VASILLATSGTAAASSPDHLHINELMIDPPCEDGGREYVEIKGAPNAVLPAGTYLVFVRNSATGGESIGAVRAMFNLSGLTLGSNGFLVLLQKDHPYGGVLSSGATKVVGTGAGWTGVAGWTADGGETEIVNEPVAALLVTTSRTPLLTDDIDLGNYGWPDQDGAVWPTWNKWDAVDTYSGATSPSNYTGTHFQDAQWVGRPIGDPSGYMPDSWVSSKFTACNDVPHPINVSTTPAGYNGKLLNHVGGPNFLTTVAVSQVGSLPGFVAGIAAVGLIGFAVTHPALRRRRFG
jgi:hypothetical protein